MDAKLNVLGEPLQPCSDDPVTGFFRDGCCNTSSDDIGMHVVCVRVTKEFLEFSRFSGNDLSTPLTEFGFWCKVVITMQKDRNNNLNCWWWPV